MQPQTINQESVIECFKVISNPKPDPNLQKQADNYLTQSEQSCCQFISILLNIFQTEQDDLIKLQSLICFSNVIKRNYLNKRIKDSTLPNIQKLKSSIKQKLISYLVNAPPMYRKTLLDIIIFIANIDYPHNFDQLINYIQQMLDNVKDTQYLRQNIKSICEIYKKKQKRSLTFNKKHFQSSSLKILIKLFNVSEQLFQNIQKLNQKQYALIRSIIKLKLLILITAPNDIVDNEQLLKAVEVIYTKLQRVLLIVSQFNAPKKSAIDPSIYQKQHLIKTILKYMSYLQYKHPFSLILCYSKYLHAIFHIINNHQKFTLQKVLKYALISLNKVLKTFVYYSNDQQFQSSSHSKSKSINFISFRNKIHQQYEEIVNEKMIEDLLSKLISEILSLKDYDSFDVGIGIDDQEGKLDEKEASLLRLSLGLIETIINRFPQYSFNLISNLVNSCISSQFNNIDNSVKVNIMNVCSILPAALKGNNSSLLLNFPIQSIISYAFNSTDLIDKFALLSCKWINKFSPQQTSQIVNALLIFIDANTNNINILLECCLAIKTIILNKSQQLDLSSAVEKVIPLAIKLFSNTQSVQILWPMITLISKLISSVECNIQTLQNALACNSLINLLQTEEQLIIEALCEMFRCILCTLPRDQQQPVTYNLILTFLSNQLVKTHLAGYQQVLKLWYLTIRQYSKIQNKDEQLKILFEKYYKLCLQSTFNEKLLYILQEYVLLELIDNDVNMFMSILISFYDHVPEDTNQQDRYKLKIASTSVHITFITKFGIGNVHNNELLVKYLDDLIETTNTTNHNKLSDTFKTSLMTLINRYIILFKQQFFTFLQGTNKYPLNVFLCAWFTGMDSLTSKTACKINAIALMSMMQDLDPQLLKNRFQFIIKKVIPEITESISVSPFLNKIGVSPTFRMSQNILSERKQNIRREGVFQDINLRQLFIGKIKNLIQKNVINQQSVQQLLGGDMVLLDSLYKLIA